MRFDPLGDQGYILRDFGMPAYRVANWLNLEKPAGLIEAVASYDTVGLYTEAGFDPTALDLPREGFAAVEPQSHSIPVCYEMGEDLDETVKRLGLTPEEFVAAHCSQEYICFAIGFCPGFGYLGYLPEVLQGVPRRSSPRTRVEPGSVAITGKQTAVYPLPRPGGWDLVGRTPLTLVDVADEFFPIQAGDVVRFTAIGPADYNALRGHRL